MQSRYSSQLLQQYVLEDAPPIYSIGTFGTGVTVWSQQIRALNLAWSLIEEGKLGVAPKQVPNIAVVGAGFSGLAFVAALLKKQVVCDITLFEEHDTLLPLQQGSDTRWLHPHIYDWPDKGSEADVAMLPIMNWTAARASDVVVQVLRDWQDIVDTCDRVKLYCNTRHLQLTKDDTDHDLCRIEWVGEPRDPIDGTILEISSTSKGSSAKFDFAVLAVGFGIEQDNYSYWRNETIGQPLLNLSRRTYLISGQGDSAMIDLIRVRFSQYRQDRILEDVFGGKDNIVRRLKHAKVESQKNRELSLFGIFDSIFNEAHDCKEESIDVFKIVSKRLRRDTDAILRIQVSDVSELLRGNTGKVSFQNALLTYLLYRVGGFSPSADEESSILKKYSIPKEFVVRRHGTERANQFKRILSKPIFDAIKNRFHGKHNVDTKLSKISWPGGYFDHAGPSSELANIDSDEIRKTWRREYLPGPTTLVTATICGAIVGAIQSIKSEVTHLRVTMHRVLPLNGENLLQQTCDYEGLGIAARESTAGRTFPADKAIIGLAYRSHRPVHTRESASRREIENTMVELGLQEAARKMAREVSYILAIPLLQPVHRYFPPNRVAGILYLDSTDSTFSMSSAEVKNMSRLIGEAIKSLAIQADGPLLGVRNVPFNEVSNTVTCPCGPVTGITEVIEYLPEAIAPTLFEPFAINFDYADPASTRRTRGGTETKSTELV